MALDHQAHTPLDTWLGHIKSLHRQHQDELDLLPEDEMRLRLTELNVIKSVHQLAKAHIVHTAWQNACKVHIHGWMFDEYTGEVREILNAHAKQFSDIDGLYILEEGELSECSEESDHEAANSERENGFPSQPPSKKASVANQDEWEDVAIADESDQLLRFDVDYERRLRAEKADADENLCSCAIS